MGKQIKRYGRRSRDLVRAGLQFVNPLNYHGAARVGRSLALVGIVLVLVLSILFPIVIERVHAQRYVLSSSAKHLLGPVQPTLADRFTYDAKDQAYYFNKKGLDAAPTPSAAPADKAGPNPAAALKQMQAHVGGGASKKDQSLYSVELPDDPTKGITYHDNNLSLSFKLTPQVVQYAPKIVNGRLVYPTKTGAQAVYTAKGNGLKEDIILKEAHGDSLQYDYQLQLPKELEARLTEDGALGIYSADPALFGNISYGSADDQARVMDARNAGKKDHLVFALPAPVINQTGKSGQGAAKAEFSLDGNTLSIKATHLNGLTYPVSIDPTVVITSSSDFATGNNEDGNIDYPTGQINRGGLTGGTVPSWTATTSFTTARNGQTSVAYNGYVYVIGGSGGGFLSSVQYAPLNANGTVGTWNPTTSFTTARFLHTSVVYNGYLYVMGGSSGSILDTVQYAPINADGTVGTWTATTSFTTGRTGHTSVAYNGYLYIIGGTSVGKLNDVQYAPLNANGTVGTWTATTSFTTARSGHTSVVYNGYLYVIGGYDGSATLADVQYAPINANGTVGTWTATTSFTTARQGHTSVVYNGYVYIMGGNPAASQLNDVQYAPINANGTIRTWNPTTSFTTGRQGHTSVVYNGNLYILGGTNGTDLADVQFSKLDPLGRNDTFATTTSIPTAGEGQSVAYAGRLYLLGGKITSNNSSQVISAPFNANGTIGAWSATTSLPAALAFGAVNISNGYIYYIGGFIYPSTDSSTVYYATVSTAGVVGTWSTTTALPVATDNFGSTIYNGYVYVVGGNTANANTAVSTVYYATVNSTGTFGSWTTNANAIPQAMYGFGLGASGGKMYLFNGSDGATDYGGYYATINTNGSVTSWTATGTGYPATYKNVLSISNGYLYLWGGGVFGSTGVSYAPINSDGTVGAFLAGASFTTAREYQGGAIYNGYLYVVGGVAGCCSTTYYSDVQYSPINNGGPGNTGTFAATTSFTAARYGHTSVVANGFVYVIGGNSGIAEASVQYAAINTNGTVGAFTATNSFTTGRYLHTSVTYNGYLYVIGGYDGTNALATTQYALMCTGSNSGSGGCTATAGTVGTWTSTTSIPTARYSHASVVANGYVYVIGGYTGAAYVATVQYAPLSATGAIGAWNSTSSFTNARYRLASVVNNGYLYVIGGNLSATYYADVQYALIGASGTIGAFAYTTSLPGPRYGHTAIITNGYLYIAAGNSGSGYQNDVQYASFNPNGTISNWVTTTGFTGIRGYPTSIVNNGYLYVMGGLHTASDTTCNATAAVSCSDVQYTPLSVMTRTAHYSKLLDFGSATGALYGITYNGILANGLNDIAFKTAGSNAIFGASTKASSFIGGPTTCIAAGTSRYALVNITLDNSQSAVFPDSSGTNNANVTDFTVNYSVGAHPPPIQRLRHGQTLQLGVLSPFDTCP